MLNFTGSIQIVKNVCDNQTAQLIYRGMNDNPCVIQDPTLHNLILPYGIDIPYHFPPSIENIIAAIFLVSFIWLLKKYFVPLFREELENIKKEKK